MILILFILQAGAMAQSPGMLLNRVYKKMNRAKDYTVQINVKVDLPFIKMLPVEARVYFKQKDKLRIDSRSIAIIPKQGFDQLGRLLNDTNTFTSVKTGNEKIGNAMTSIVNIIPLSDTGEIILGKLWIDPVQDVVLKSQLTTRSSGTILTEYTYGSQLVNGLPDRMVFTVDVKRFKIPKSVSADIQSKSKKPGSNERQGKIEIRLYNYQINKGIPDSVFKNK